MCHPQLTGGNSGPLSGVPEPVGQGREGARQRDEEQSRRAEGRWCTHQTPTTRCGYYHFVRWKMEQICVTLQKAAQLQLLATQAAWEVLKGSLSR